MIFERGHFKSDTVKTASIKDLLNESLGFSKTASYTAKPTVFLSHKHNDLEEDSEVRGVIELLQNLGAKVYIDSMDNSLPKQTTGETAQRIKNIIEYCNKFILLATDKAIESYWCNWELGIGDVHKYIKHIAILPIKEKNTLDSSYKGNEYLQVYPKIEYHNAFTNRDGHFFKSGYYVCWPLDKEGRRTFQLLQDWIKENNK